MRVRGRRPDDDGARRLARRLRADERGAVLPVAAVTMVAFLGLSGLVVDLGRLYNTNTELQSYADAAALAAAAELDGLAGARARAEQAGRAIVDQQTFGTGGATLTIPDDGFRFFAAIPDDTSSPTPTRGPIQGGTPAAGDADANFVEVTVRQETVSMFFAPVLAAFGGDGMTEATTQAWATATMTQVVCRIPPLMICNPFEPEGRKFTEADVGMQIRSKAQGSGYTPGIFGVLDLPGFSTVALIRDAMARINPDTPCVSTMVSAKPGENTGPVKQGMNVRFDIYEGPMSGNKGSAAHAPAKNVTKGLTPACTVNQLATTQPLPRDDCFAAGTCLYGRFGNGDWDHDAYWNANHAPLGHVKPAGYDTMTRFEVYRWETTTAGMIPNGIAGGENGNPTCSTEEPVSNPNLDRRVIVVPSINCIAEGMQGNTPPSVRVVQFLKMFLTEPLGVNVGGYQGGDTDPQDIWVEIIGVAEPGADDGILHEFPNLVR